MTSVSDSDDNSDVRRCSSWNTFRKDGCQYEFLNPGKKCVFLHCCSICEYNGFGIQPHKSLERDHELDPSKLCKDIDPYEY